jgi:hypothetical protein
MMAHLQDGWGALAVLLLMVAMAVVIAAYSGREE